MLSRIRKGIKRVWETIPENRLKNRARVALYNYNTEGGKPFLLENDVFVTDVPSVPSKLSSIDHPFHTIEAMQQYQAQHVVQQGAVVIDAGAHNGHLSICFASIVGSNGKVIAVEPDDANLTLLKRNFALNQHASDVQLVANPLWDKNETISFCQMGTVASSAFGTPDAEATITKETITIDQIVAQLGLTRLDFVKMDIEGAEVKALQGAQETIRTLRPDFAIASYHIVDGQRTYPLIEDMFQSFGYHYETVFLGNECITYGTGKQQP